MTLKLGIIGYGGMGGWHRKNAARVDGVEVVAAYDIDPARVEAAKETGLKGYYTLDSFLADPEINIVLVATPNHVHKELAIAAANAGKNVIVEKPVAISIKEVDEIIEAAEKNKVLFTVHQNRRWDKDYCIMRKAVESGILGDVYNIESRVHGSGGKIYGWRAVKEYGGGMLLDWGVHLLDQILYMYPENKVVSIYAQLFSVLNPGVDDYFKILMKLDNGVSVQVEVGTFCLRSLPRWYVGGNAGTLTIENFEGKGGITRVKKLMEEVEPEIVETAAGPTRTFAPQPVEVREEIGLPEANPDWTDFYRNVLNTIEGKEELIVKPSEVRRVFSVMEAAFKSNELGRSLDVNL